MKHEDIAQYVLKELMKRGADDVIIHLTSGESSLLKFVNNKISTTKTADATAAQIFLVKDQRILISSLKTFNEKAARNFCTTVLKNVTKVQPNKEYQGITQGPCKYLPRKETYDSKIETMDEELIEIIKQSTDLARKTVKRTAGTLEKSSWSTTVLSSNNIAAEEKGTALYFAIRALITKDASGYGTAVSRMKQKLDFIGATTFATTVAKNANRKRVRVTGAHDTVFGPHAFAAIIEHVGDAASIFSIESGLSFLENKQGHPIASNKLTLYDDPTLPNGYASTSFDDEGTPTQKTTIIKKGLLKTYLHNTSTAKRYHTKTTGNAGLISPHPHNLVLEKGTVTTEDLFDSVKNGVYISNVWYTRFNNYHTGDFSTIPRDGAFLIKNGQITHALKDIRISDNILRMLRDTKFLGKERHQIRSWEVQTPTVVPFAVVKNVNITGPE